MINRFLPILMLCAILFAVAAPVAAADKPQATLTVTGHAEMAVTPNVAVLAAGVVTTGATVEAARGENDRLMRRVIDALSAQGIGHDKIATAQFSLQPLYREDGKDNSAITGYRLQNTVTVAIEDLNRVGPVIDAVFAAGANQFQGLRFGLKDDSQIRDELLGKAVQDGRRKALVMAEALGVNLGQPLTVSEAGQFSPLQDSNRMLKTVAAGTPIEAGTMTISLDVAMTFAL